jgi:hypothetical protein
VAAQTQCAHWPACSETAPPLPRPCRADAAFRHCSHATEPKSVPNGGQPSQCLGGASGLITSLTNKDRPRAAAI